MKRITLTFLLACCTMFFAQAQCTSEEVEVSILVETDAYGYEIYWELLPNGNDCGSDAIFTGGNMAVGCNGGGNESQIPGGYANDASITEGPWCLTEGQDYDILFIDDWADGGATYSVSVSGYPLYEFSGSSSDETFTFTASEPPALDIAILSVETSLYVDMENIDIKGNLSNIGTTTINSLELNYSIDGGAIITESLTGLNITPFHHYSYIHNTQWIPTTIGTYSLSVWISNINGQGDDANLGNNEITKVITIKTPIPNIISSYTSSLNNFTYNQIGSPFDQVNKPTDLDFHPNGDLWLVNRGTEDSGGSTVKFTNPGEYNQDSERKQDGNAWHFMSLPSGIAFSNNGNFGTSTSVFDANHENEDPFTGPTLWSSDPAIYAQPSGGNGSHLDMLHESPHCMGIASEKENVFWVLDGYSKDIVRYDFAMDHGPGNDDHADGIIRRYKGMSVDYINTTIPCHLELDKNKEWLYIVDGGNQRVIRLNINSGNTPINISGANEPIDEYSEVFGATWEVVVDNGLEQPCGIDVIEDRMIVSDYSNGDIIVYDISTIPAIEMARLQTNSSSITGVVVGPKGRIWYTNYEDHKVFKIEPSQIIGISENANDFALAIYPNPTLGKVIIVHENFSSEVSISLIDIRGAVLFNVHNVKESSSKFDFSNYSSGLYYLSVTDGKTTSTKKLVIE